MAKALVVAGFLATGCGLASAQTTITADDPQIVEGSKKEDGLLIYSNLADTNWKPLLETFRQHYPWIKVDTLNMGPDEAFTRYSVESGSGARSADVLAVGSIQGWLAFLEKSKLLAYEPPEVKGLPAWSRVVPNLYAMSADPMLIVYNKLLVPAADQPKSMADIARLAATKPQDYARGFTTYDGLDQFGLSIHYSWLKAKGEEGWAELAKFGPLTVMESSGGNMLAKLTSGEVKIGYAVSAITFFPRMGGAQDKLLGWTFPADGTPLVVRGIGIPEKARNVNSAKLFENFVLSEEGQKALGRGGLAPYRPGIGKSDVKFESYDSIVERVGEKNIVLVNYTKEFLGEIPAYQKRWKATVSP
uniref:Extracellular solute-binding protein n=1 Tax=Bosea sp. NBC_00436 TaxID=2969620 RepID=A0A9E8CP73_9HYPH